MAVEALIPAEQRLRQQLRAMRHLPPGTSLAELGSPLAQRLFTELLHLPDADNPLLWLERERGDEVALLTLASLLDFARRLARSIHAASQAAGESPAWLSLSPDVHESALDEFQFRWVPLFGDFREWHEGEGPTQSWMERTVDINSGPDLVAALVRLRVQSRLGAEPSPNRSLQEPAEELLLADLLRLPENFDPLRWLQKERGPLCARLVLEHLVSDSFPQTARAETIGLRARSSIRATVHAYIGDELSVDVERIELFEHGFTVHIRTTFLWPKSDERNRITLVRWEGFDQFIDSNGFHYLVQVGESQTSLLWPSHDRWRERLVLVGSPALRDAEFLELASRPTALAAYRISALGNRLVPLAMPILGECTCIVPLRR